MYKNLHIARLSLEVAIFIRYKQTKKELDAVAQVCVYRPL